MCIHPTFSILPYRCTNRITLGLSSVGRACIQYSLAPSAPGDGCFRYFEDVRRYIDLWSTGSDRRAASHVALARPTERAAIRKPECTWHCNTGCIDSISTIRDETEGYWESKQQGEGEKPTSLAMILAAVHKVPSSARLPTSLSLSLATRTTSARILPRRRHNFRLCPRHDCRGSHTALNP